MATNEARALRTAGVDAGSSSIKVALIESERDGVARVLALRTQRIRRRNVHEVVQATFEEARSAASVDGGALDYVASTGDGDAVPFRTGHFYSMTTHASGAKFLVPETRAALDVGALHARAIRMDERSKVLAHRMTSQCASGSGQFLENIARYLGVALADVGRLSLEAGRSETVSSICAVLAETDVINMVSRGIGTADILRGIHESIAGRLARLVRGVKAQGVVLVTGGLSQDVGLIECLRQQVNLSESERALPPLDVRTHADAIFAGAIGAALLAARRHRQLARSGRGETVLAPGRVYSNGS
jgi:benzoyl-CoA reductase subunit D